MNKNPVIAILYHIFYEDSYEAVCNELQPLQMYSPALLFNICTDTPGRKNMAKQLKQTFPGCFVIFTSNRGKDIGAKLAMFQLLLQIEMSADYILLLHDKKSLQALKNITWKNDLLKIILPGNIETILRYFQQNKNCGLITTKEYIVTEPFENNQFTGMNGTLLERLLVSCDIKPASFEFVAGTMFWARATPLLEFFMRFSPLAIRKELENGNVMDNFSGTSTHSWERLLCWIVTAKNFYIKGI
ncbi:MAG: rhamnan synthesis F family protein [Chitinophagaceae bacterium]